MRTTLVLALLALACSSDPGGDVATGAAGASSDGGEAGQGAVVEARATEAPETGVGGSGAVVPAGVGGAPGVGGATGDAGSAGNNGSSGSGAIPYDIGDGKRCPQIALDALRVSDKFNPGVPEYAEGTCRGTWISDRPGVDEVSRAVVGFGAEGIGVIPNSCARVVVIPEDGSDPQCAVTGWYPVETTRVREVFFTGSELLKPSVGYWLVIDYRARVPADRDSVCPDTCSEFGLGGAVE